MGTEPGLAYAGPWYLSQLIDDPRCQIPCRPGCYLVSIRREEHDQHRHGFSEFIYIGGMGGSENASLAKRIGEFIAAAFGFGTYHSGGIRFWKKRQEHEINPWDLAFWWYTCECPTCCEVELFRAFANAHEGGRPLLNANRRRSRCAAGHPVQVIVPWT